MCCGRARLASCPIPSTPRGRDAARLGWRVLPGDGGLALSAVVSPSLPCLQEEGEYSWSVGLGFPVVPGCAEPWHGFLATSGRMSAACCFLCMGGKKTSWGTLEGVWHQACAWLQSRVTHPCTQPLLQPFPPWKVSPGLRWSRAAKAACQGWLCREPQRC